MKSYSWLTLIAATATLISPGLSAAQIVISGNNTESGGGDFADYTSLSSGDEITESIVNDGVVSLSIQDNGAALWSTGNSGGHSYVSGAEINFGAGAVSSDLADAISDDAFFDITIDSTSYGSELFNLNGISVDLWRNGPAAATGYQFAYSSDGVWDTSDALGTAVEVATSVSGPGDSLLISYDSSTIVSSVSDATVRLYYWGAANATGNSHIFNVSADYSAIPEPSHYAVFAGLLSIAIFSLRRRRRG